MEDEDIIGFYDWDGAPCRILRNADDPESIIAELYVSGEGNVPVSRTAVLHHATKIDQHTYKELVKDYIALHRRFGLHRGQKKKLHEFDDANALARYWQDDITPDNILTGHTEDPNAPDKPNAMDRQHMLVGRGATICMAYTMLQKIKEALHSDEPNIISELDDDTGEVMQEGVLVNALHAIRPDKQRETDQNGTTETGTMSNASFLQHLVIEDEPDVTKTFLDLSHIKGEKARASLRKYIASLDAEIESYRTLDTSDAFKNEMAMNMVADLVRRGVLSHRALVPKEVWLQFKAERDETIDTKHASSRAHDHALNPDDPFAEMDKKFDAEHRKELRFGRLRDEEAEPEGANLPNAGNLKDTEDAIEHDIGKDVASIKQEGLRIRDRADKAARDKEKAAQPVKKRSIDPRIQASNRWTDGYISLYSTGRKPDASIESKLRRKMQSGDRKADPDLATLKDINRITLVVRHPDDIAELEELVGCLFPPREVEGGDIAPRTVSEDWQISRNGFLQSKSYVVLDEDIEETSLDERNNPKIKTRPAQAGDPSHGFVSEIRIIPKPLARVEKATSLLSSLVREMEVMEHRPAELHYRPEIMQPFVTRTEETEYFMRAYATCKQLYEQMAQNHEEEYLLPPFPEDKGEKRSVDSTGYDPLIKRKGMEAYKVNYPKKIQKEQPKKTPKDIYQAQQKKLARRGIELPDYPEEGQDGYEEALAECKKQYEVARYLSEVSVNGLPNVVKYVDAKRENPDTPHPLDAALELAGIDLDSIPAEVSAQYSVAQQYDKQEVRIFRDRYIAAERELEKRVGKFPPFPTGYEHEEVPKYEGFLEVYTDIAKKLETRHGIRLPEPPPGDPYFNHLLQYKEERNAYVRAKFERGLTDLPELPGDPLKDYGQDYREAKEQYDAYYSKHSIDKYQQDREAYIQKCQMWKKEGCDLPIPPVDPYADNYEEYDVARKNYEMILDAGDHGFPQFPNPPLPKFPKDPRRYRKQYEECKKAYEEARVQLKQKGEEIPPFPDEWDRSNAGVQEFKSLKETGVMRPKVYNALRRQLYDAVRELNLSAFANVANQQDDPWVPKLLEQAYLKQRTHKEDAPTEAMLWSVTDDPQSHAEAKQQAEESYAANQQLEAEQERRTISRT